MCGRAGVTVRKLLSVQAVNSVRRLGPVRGNRSTSLRNRGGNGASLRRRAGCRGVPRIIVPANRRTIGDAVMPCGRGALRRGVVGRGSNSVTSVRTVIGLPLRGCAVRRRSAPVSRMCLVIVVIVTPGRANVGVPLLSIGGKTLVPNEVALVSALSAVSNVGPTILLKANQ